jgi:phage tail sheath protein FI
MAEYLAPGVFVEETSFRSKSIEGVSTSTTAFVGPTRTGPVGIIPEILTSFADFERIYGGLSDLAFASGAPNTNYLAHSVMAYFNEGGARLYVSRVSAGTPAASTDLINGTESKVKARFPGSAGNGKALLRQVSQQASLSTAAAAIDGSLILIPGNAAAVPPVADGVFVKQSGVWKDSAKATKTFVSADEASMQLVTLKVQVTNSEGKVFGEEGLGFDPQHKRFVGNILSPNPSRRADQLAQQYAVSLDKSVTAYALFAATKPDSGSDSKALDVSGGSDTAPALQNWKDALALVEGLEDVSILAAPGHTEQDPAIAPGIASALVSQAEKRNSYRVAVLDVPQGKLVSEAQAYKSKFDSKYAALYYPWVVTPNPDFNPNDPRLPAEVTLPPSGFLCGIYARSDIERGVFKAPANEVIRSAVRFERLVTNGEQELLNPLGVNCLRAFTNRGNRVWGARTTSSDPEWKYINVRRYFLYLEHSIDRGTQWSVFEPNGERLWANVRDSVLAFLYNEWMNGALLGDRPEQAYFVKCDRNTMTQNDLDNGRLVCLVGVAALKPAEFVIFRIGQKTADAKS